jgi:hypothetical protein
VWGWREPSGFGPPAGFRYDGLYRVGRYWSDVGRSHFKIWRFLLIREDPTPPPLLDWSRGGIRSLGYSRPSKCQYGTASASPASVTAA